MTKKSTFIVYAKRTAIGNLMGVFQNTPAPRLGATLVKDCLSQNLVNSDEVDEIIMGNVLTAGIGQAPARQTAIYGGLPESVRAMTINKVCGSGLKSVMLADQAIRLGDADIIMAGGQENMTMAPHLMLNARQGYRFGDVTIKDHMQYDGLWDPYNNMAMGVCGEICAKEYQFTREAQDEYSRRSCERAMAADASGHFAAEIVGVEIKNRKDTVLIKNDEKVATLNPSKLAALRPAFDPSGTITAGNASSINDGAAMTLLMSEEKMNQKKIKPLARIVSQASFAQDPKWFTTAPVAAIKNALKISGLKLGDIDLFEINEAFAVVPMVAIHDLELDPMKVNIHGGAVALGHPIGASGTRVLVTLLNALRAQKKRYGLATLCIGGGEASAVIVENLA